MTSTEALLRAVRDFLKDSVQPQLTETAAWQNRISVNVLGIIEREQRLRPLLNSLDREFAGDEGEAEDTLVSLARGLRDASVPADAQTRRYLRRRSLLRLLIDNPRYSAVAQAKAAWPDDAAWLEVQLDTVGSESSADH